MVKLFLRLIELVLALLQKLPFSLKSKPTQPPATVTTMPTPTPSRHLNDRGMVILKGCEGLELKAYRDAVGVLTIGYGSTGTHVKEGMEITAQQAEDLLKKDLARFEIGVASLVTVPMTDNQFSALVVFSFNVGLGNLKSSTLLKKLNASDIPGAAEQFLRWDKAGGKVLPGLVKRRKMEQELFLT